MGKALEYLKEYEPALLSIKRSGVVINTEDDAVELVIMCARRRQATVQSLMRVLNYFQNRWYLRAIYRHVAKKVHLQL